MVLNARARLLTACVALGAVAAVLSGFWPVHAQSVPAGYQPGLGDFMNGLVQPRHAKLGLAGQAGNWPLAAYELKVLHEAFDSTAKAIPKYRNISVPDMIEALIKTPLQETEDAIKAKDAAKFTAAYAKLTAGCDSCHQSAGVRFVVIKPPDHSGFANQDFAPKR